MGKVWKIKDPQVMTEKGLSRFHPQCGNFGIFPSSTQKFREINALKVLNATCVDFTECFIIYTADCQLFGLLFGNFELSYFP